MAWFYSRFASVSRYLLCDKPPKGPLVLLDNLLSLRPAAFFHQTAKSTAERETELVPSCLVEPKETWIWAQPEGHDTGIQIKNSYYCIRKEGLDVRVPFIVPNPNYVTWYACGPTVYDSSHIGHASTYLHCDLIRRILTKYFDLNICMVMGITNMDKKIINKAMLHDRDFMEIPDTYEREFKRDMDALNILPPTTYIRVTDVIPQIIDFIQKILDKKQAYINNKGDVYFSYNSAHQSPAKLYKEFFEEDISVSEKRFVKDFSLWKTPSPGEPYWDAPWGRGRPGWHIECSVMASMCFGDNLDIHTGANDLRFPHHEYEIVQCDAYHGCHQWVNYFLHTGHLQTARGDKMSKSLGNFVTIEEFLKTYNDPDILRMLCCETQWWKNSKLTPDFKQQLNFIKHLTKFIEMCREISSGRKRVSLDNEAVLKALANCEENVLRHFKNNFDIPSAMSEMKKLVLNLRECMKKSTTSSDVSPIIKTTNFVENFFDNLGFTFHRRLQ